MFHSLYRCFIVFYIIFSVFLSFSFLCSILAHATYVSVRFLTQGKIATCATTVAIFEVRHLSLLAHSYWHTYIMAATTNKRLESFYLPELFVDHTNPKLFSIFFLFVCIIQEQIKSILYNAIVIFLVVCFSSLLLCSAAQNNKWSCEFMQVYEIVQDFFAVSIEDRISAAQKIRVCWRKSLKWIGGAVNDRLIVDLSFKDVVEHMKHLYNHNFAWIISSQSKTVLIKRCIGRYRKLRLGHPSYSNETKSHSEEKQQQHNYWPNESAKAAWKAR